MMPPDHIDGAVVIRAPAKINLRLRVLAREESGYHQIETIFCAVDLADRLEIRPGPPGIGLEVVGAVPGAPADNLVHRAAVAFSRAAGISPAVRIRLEKHIPVGAGLGGGSSDAAATLRALNKLAGRPLAPSVLLRIGATLGSDVPFFLGGSALALAWGRGERLLTLPPLPSVPVIIVSPGFAIATADAYRDLARLREGIAAPPAPALLHGHDLGSWTAIAALAGNDFEPPTFQRYPALAELRTALHDAGATIALLAGSGSSLFGIFADEETRAAATDRIATRPDGPRLVAARTVPA